ncbi:MAG: hypothetical protein R3C03_07055 [Pirellulaceae bacterium]
MIPTGAIADSRDEVVLSSFNHSLLMKPDEFKQVAIQFLKQNRWLILVPVAICAILSLAYSFVSPRPYVAAQTLMLRDDLLGDSYKPGRFQSEESLKNAQQTVLHVVRKPAVVCEALKKAFPERYPDLTPDSGTVDSYRDKISIAAPNGAEFGKTDLIILNIAAENQDECNLIATALCDELEINLQAARSDMLLSMENELQIQVDRTSELYRESADNLTRIEKSVGEDLESLRAMVEKNGGSGELQRALEKIRDEKRVAENELDLIEKQLEYLKQFDLNRDSPMATNAELLQMQPALSRLHNGLVDAKLKLATDLGRFLENHPTITEDRNAVARTKAQIEDELGTIEEGLLLQHRVAADKLLRLKDLEAEYRNRSITISDNRVDYQTLSAEVSQRGESLAKLQSNLAEVQSLASTDRSYTLLTRIGAPEIRPGKGISRAMLLILGCVFGGLMGLGIAIIANGPESPVNEWLRRSANQLGQLASRPSTANPETSANDTTASYGAGGRPETRRRPIDVIRDADRRPEQKRPQHSTPPEKTLVGAAALGNIRKNQIDTTEGLTVIEYAKNETANGNQPSEQLRPKPKQTPPEQVGAFESNSETVIKPVHQTRESNAPKSLRDAIQEFAASQPNADKKPELEPPKKLDGNVKPAEPDPIAAFRNEGGADDSQVRTMLMDSEELLKLRSEISQSHPSSQVESKPEKGSHPGESLDTHSSTSENQKRLKERLNQLSESISAYCQPIKKKPE